MFPLKVQRGAVRRGLGAPQAAPGLPKAGGAAGRREGGGKRARGGAERGRPPDRRKRRRAGGAGRVPRLRTPRPWTAARTPSGCGRAAALGGRAELRNRGRVASRSRTSRHRPRQPRRPAGSRAALAGAPRRRADNGGRQSAGAARAPSSSHPSPPAGLTSSRPLRRPTADALEAPTHTAPAAL